MVTPRVVHSLLIVVMCLASQCLSKQMMIEKTPIEMEGSADVDPERIRIPDLPESFPYWRENADAADLYELDESEAESRATCKCDDRDIYSQLDQLQDFRRKVRNSPGMCYVGIFNGKINLSQLRASSIYNHHYYQLYNAGLFSPHAWAAAKNDGHQWIQVDFLGPNTITGVATQGRASADQWVQRYHVLYGNSANSLQYYKEHGSVKVFTGNKDRNTIVENMLHKPVTARYVRIHPVAWYVHISMRFELRQC